MLASFFQPQIATANLLFIGMVQGLIISMLAMGIVLDLPVDARHQLRGRRHRRARSRAPRGHGRTLALPVLAVAARSQLLTTTAAGAVIEMVVIRRLSKAPRVIVLVATIGVAELDAGHRAHAARIPDGQFQTIFPSPINSHWTISSLCHLGLGGFHVQMTNIVTGARSSWRSSSCRSSPSGCGGCSATPFRRGGARVRDQPRPRAHDRHQPQDDVDRDLDDRRIAFGHHADALRDAERHDRPGAGRSGDVAAGADRGTDRRHDVVPADRCGRDRRRPALSGPAVQLPEHAGPGGVRAVPPRAGARRAHQPGRRGEHRRASRSRHAFRRCPSISASCGGCGACPTSSRGSRSRSRSSFRS